MKKILAFLISLLFSLSCFAQSGQQFANLGSFELEDGEFISNCKIGYRTFGTLNSDKSNAVIFPTWFGGTSEHVGNLIGPKKMLDNSKLYVIVVDALGNGISSSPSNSVQQQGTQFPQFNIRDMVHSQHKLLTEKLDIFHLYGAIGGSMGGMQIFEWLVLYPGFINKAIPYVGSPRLTYYDMLLFNTYLQIIESGRNSNTPEKEIMKSLQMLTALTQRTPQYLASKKSRTDIPNYIKSLNTLDSPAFTVDNWESQTRAILTHDISSQFGNSLENAAKVMKAKVFIIVSATDHIIRPEPALSFSKLINANTLILNNDCGHLAIGCEMQKCSNAINNFFKE